MASVKDWITDKVTDWLVRERGAFAVPLFDFDRLCETLRPGDVLLVEGSSHVSTVIRHISHSPWTHAALYLGRLHDIHEPTLRAMVSKGYEGDLLEPLLVESLLGEGTIIAPVSKYRPNHLRICRPIGLSAEQTQQVLLHVVRRLGAEYDARELLGSALPLLRESLFPRHRPTARSLARKRRREGAICSSMLGQAFMSVGFPVLPQYERPDDGEPRPSLRAFQRLSPRDFDHSPTFEIIKCPLDEELHVTLAQAATLECEPVPESERKEKPSGSAWTSALWGWRKRKNRSRPNTSVPNTDTGPPD